MNIVTETFAGRSIVRPDTTFAKASGEFYVPDGVSELRVSPVLVSKITRAAKAVPQRFTPRYFQEYGLGLYLYPDGDDFCDRTSFLPLEMYQEAAEIEHLGIEMSAGEEKLWASTVDSAPDTIGNALAHCTIRTFVRRGDYIVKELAAPVLVTSGCADSASGGNTGSTIALSLNGKKIVEIEVIF